MANEQTIDQLNIEINTKAKQSSSGMDKLIASIEKLRNVTGTGNGALSGISASLDKLISTMSDLKGKSGSVTSLASSIEKLNDVKTNNIVSNLNTVKNSLKSLGDMNPEVKELVNSLGALAKSGNGGVAGNALKLQAEAAKAQATIDKSALTSAKAQEGLQAIADKNQKIAESAKFAAEAEQSLNSIIAREAAKVSTPTISDGGPIRAPVKLTGSKTATEILTGKLGLNEAINAAAGLNQVSNSSSKATGFVNKLKSAFNSAKEGATSFGSSAQTAFRLQNFYGAYFIIRQVASTVGGFITNINSYIENMNLFSVAMGKSAQSGEQLAQTLQNVLGIDSGEAMRYMGVFEQMNTSFGIANKQATIMSENFTQLGYDIASYYNISTSAAFTKLQSGLAGQTKALRQLGIDTSVARLQQELYNLGIKEKVKDLNEADKAELIYIATMKQTKNAQGDMARTIQTPANALRVLQAQATIAGRAIGSIFIPALEMILPPAIAVVEVIGEVASSIASLVGFKMPKIDYSSLNTGLSGVADDADNAATGVGDIGKNAKDANKQMNDLIGGFDELNILNSNDSSAAAAGAGAGAGKSVLDGIKLPQYNALSGQISSQINSLKNQIKSALADITAIASGALLAIGAILVLTGTNIPLGLGLMAIGAVGLAADIALNWKSMNTPLLNTLTTITAAVGGFLLALGAIMAFSGANIPLGVGLMAAGAISLGTSVAIDWNSTKTNVSTVLSGITGLISGASLAVGGMLAFTGVNVPLGIGLMAVGATGIASAVALNWSSMDSKTKETLSSITAAVGGSMLAVGALLTLTGVNPMLGIPMMAVGASSLATAVAINWNNMSDSLRGQLTTITSFVGGGLLALGAILAFTGVGIPMGVTMMAIGAASLATAVGLNWDFLKDKIKAVLADILSIASMASVAIGLMLCLTGVGIPLGIGLILAGGAGIGKAQSISATPITDWAKNAMDSVTSKFNQGLEGIKSLFRNIRLPSISIPSIHFPDIKLPHFSISYDSDGWGADAFKFLGMSGTPSIGVDWYAKGGVFDQTSVIGVGEYAGAASNPEIVTPQAIMRETVEEANKSVIAAINSKSSNSDGDDQRKIEMLRIALIAAFKEAGGDVTVILNSIVDTDMVSKKVFKVQKDSNRRYTTQEA